MPLKHRFLTAVCLLIFVTSLQAQINITAGRYIEVAGARFVDHLYLFDDLSNVEVTYVGSGTPTFYLLGDNTPVCSGTTSCSQFEDGGTYVVRTNSDSIVFAVFDYSRHAAIFHDLSVDDDNPTPCDNVRLTLTSQQQGLTYPTYYGPQTIVTPMSLCWNTLEWSEGERKWVTKPQCMQLEATTSPLHIATTSAPLCDTYFTINDIYADSLQMEDSLRTDDAYTAVAVAAHITTVTVARTDSNEVNRPDSAALQGSGPLDIEFRANPTPAARYFEWKIRKSSDLLAQRSDENHRYTFTESGAYNVGLTVSNGEMCSVAVDSVNITVNESIIDVPNVFTPNGDGLNDEFRVAYRSLKQFDCWVYNRWGKLVYHWSDPQRGWDGKINGRDAAPGAYFYIIRATGSDGQKYKLSGDINIIGR